MGGRDRPANVLAFTRHGGWRMNRVDVYRLYEAGHQTHPVTQLFGEIDPLRLFSVLTGARAALTAFLGPPEMVPMTLSKGAAIELLNEVDRVFSRHFVEPDTGNWRLPPDNAPIHDFWVEQVRTRAVAFEAILRSDMQNAAIYSVAKKGSYETSDLVDQADITFSPTLGGVIGEQAKSEYRNAGRALAFGLDSAAGYHACRAVEAVLRAYVRHCTGKPDDKMATWHDLLKALEDPNCPIKAEPKTLHEIKALKDFDRNPLMHLRVTLTPEDADIILSRAKVVMTLMAQEIPANAQNVPAIAAA